MRSSIESPASVVTRERMSRWSLVWPSVASVAIMLICVFYFDALTGVDSDTAWQLRAVQQFHHGEATSFYSFVMPNPTDLAKDIDRWIVWWAPGNAFLLSHLLTAGFTIAGAVRLLGSLLLLSGAIGWSLWLARFQLPRPLFVALSAVWPWSVYAHSALFYYGAESLLFGTVPWVLLLVLKFGKFEGSLVRQSTVGAATGFLVGLIYALKYTGAFVAVGAMLFVLAEVIRRRSFSLGEILPAVFCWIACGIPILGINFLNSQHSTSMNLVTASPSLHFDWRTPLSAIANPVLAAADADALLGRVLNDYLHLTPTAVEIGVGMAALPGAMVLWFLLFRQIPTSPAGRLGSCVLLASIVCLVLIWSISWGASYEPRHLAAGAMAILPYAVEQALLLNRRIVRNLMILVGACYVMLPFSYGATVFVVRTMRFASYQPGPSGLYNQYFAEHDVRSELEALLRDYNPATDIWYVTHPLVALDLPGRVVVRRTAEVSPAEMKREILHTRVPLRVRLILPNAYGANGKAHIIRKSFPNAEEWQQREIGPDNLCWVSWIRPSTEIEIAAPRPVLSWAERR